MMKKDKFIEKVDQEFESEIDSISLNHDLLKKIKKENPKKKRFLPFWIQSPIWNYGFGLAALLFALLYFLKPTETKELIVYRDNPKQILKDTLFLKDTVFIEKEVIKNNNVRLVSNQPSSKKRSQKRPTQIYTFDEQYFDAKQLQEQQKMVGKSSEESRELAQFLGIQL